MANRLNIKARLERAIDDAARKSGEALVERAVAAQRGCFGVMAAVSQSDSRTREDFRSRGGRDRVFEPAVEGCRVVTRQDFLAQALAHTNAACLK